MTTAMTDQADNPTPTPGQCIAAYITSRGWTQVHAAEQAGLSPQRISDLVADRAGPTTNSLARLADAWGCAMHDLVP